MQPTKPRPTSIDGALIVDKPVGPTSHDVVICARRSLGTSRIGHTGTLDPQASGVLPLVLGQATRLARHLMRTDKEYLATVRFGVATDTHDAAGVVIREDGRVPSFSEVEAALEPFRGTFTQVPPLYSAKMVGGERSYVRARAGKPVQPSAAEVTAHELTLLNLDGPLARLRIRCTAGFYVRSLAQDLGVALDCGAILDTLVRTEAAGFRVEDAIPFETVLTAGREDLRSKVRPMETLLPNVPAALLTANGVHWARHGRDLGPREVATPLAVVPPLVRMMTPDGRLLGLAERSNMPGFLHPAVVFSYN
jgi:tRNA pseudouridine55 synthase